MNRFLLLFFFSITIACSSKNSNSSDLTNSNKEQNLNNQTSNKSNIELVFEKYNDWRNEQIELGNFNDSCIDLDNENALNDMNARYALPKISELTSTRAEYLYDHSIDTFSCDLNNDSRLDFLIRVLPKDCLNGNGIFSTHPGEYLLLLSEKNAGYINNTSSLKAIRRTLNQYINNIKSYSADRIYFTKIYKDEHGMRTLEGTFSVWVGDDGSCCNSIEAIFKVYDFNPDDLDYYINIEGTIKQDQDGNRNSRFEKRLKVVE